MTSVTSNFNLIVLCCSVRILVRTFFSRHNSMTTFRNMSERRTEHLFGTNHSCLFPPLPQARHRYVRVANRIVLYDPHRAAKAQVRMAVMLYLMNQYNISDENYPFTTSYVSVNVTFLVSRPKYHFIQGDRSRGICPRFDGVMPTVQGDIDNFVKFFLDAIHGIFFRDDRDVVRITASKLFTNEARGRIVYNICRYEMNIVDLLTVNDDNESNIDEN